MRVFIYPGSFNPLTNGHVDIIRRASGLCDLLIVAILINREKKPIFSADERIQMVRTAIQDHAGIEVVQFDGLLVDLYRQRKASAVVRGLRSESDYRFEAELAAANKILLPEYETFLLPSRIDLAFTSSSIVREVAAYGGDITGMVPASIAELIVERLSRRPVEDSDHHLEIKGD